MEDRNSVDPIHMGEDDNQDIQMMSMGYEIVAGYETQFLQQA